jgi:hypothetical protein
VLRIQFRKRIASALKYASRIYAWACYSMWGLFSPCPDAMACASTLWQAASTALCPVSTAACGQHSIMSYTALLCLPVTSD